MENIRVFEENGYIHFIMRPEDLMRLRYSEQSTIAFSAFMDGWLGQMKTQVRQNTMDGYRYAFEKHIRPFFDARGMTLATARPMDFQDFVNFKFEQGLSPTSIAKFHSIMHKCLKYAVALQIIPNNPADPPHRWCQSAAQAAPLPRTGLRPRAAECFPCGGFAVPR